ncbi:hypothetical protein EDC04DRAFT_2569671 [Pisolithus marmoratus]|nr:hypothetical protein EDC04DRAFT_2569671 [Pisolithus marmoratus]
MITPTRFPIFSPIFLSSYSQTPRSVLRRGRLRHSSSSSPESGGDIDRSSPGAISDHEWDIRTGRTIYVLQQTLPDFFRIGLVSNVGPTRGPGLVYNAPSEQTEIENIYSPKIRLTYTPPVALPSPFPRTLSIEGLPLYLASSVFIRHTMKTLYSDLRVELRKVVVQVPPLTPKSNEAGHSRSAREKSLFIGLMVLGTTRVSGGQGEWQIDSTYSFSPLTGLVNLHTINSIQPAPHQAAYDALRASFSNVFGLGGSMQPGEARAVDSTKARA